MIDASHLHRMDPVLLDLGMLKIRWYGVSYLMGFLVAGIILYMLGKKRRVLVPPQNAVDVILIFVFGVVVGGRLGYVLFYSPSLLTDLSGTFPYWGVFAIQKGGMASHGGMAGVLAAAWWISRGFVQEDGTRIGKAPLFHIADVSCLIAVPGLLFGRLANFVNGELLGRIVAMPGEPGPWWSVRFPEELLSEHRPKLTPEQTTALLDLAGKVRVEGDTDGAAVERLVHTIQSKSTAAANELATQLTPLLAARHPSQLYQAAAEGLVVGGLLWLIWAKPRKPGVITASFLLMYGVLRILIEQYWRLPDPLKTQYILGLTRGQWLSVGMLAAGAGLLVWAVRRPGMAFSWRKPIESADLQAQ